MARCREWSITGRDGRSEHVHGQRAPTGNGPVAPARAVAVVASVGAVGGVRGMWSLNICGGACSALRINPFQLLGMIQQSG